MYFMEQGVRQDVIPAYDETSQEYGYVIQCSECGSFDFMVECDFLDFVEEFEIDLIMENEDDECDCECGECCEVCEPDEFEDECTCEVCEYDSIRADIIGELKMLKKAFKFYASEGRWKEYDEIFELYSKMYNLAFND